MLYLKSCQRKHGERGGRAGGSEQTEVALEHTHDASCTQEPGDSADILSQARELSPSESEGVEKRVGSLANPNVVAKSEQLELCLECEDSGPGANDRSSLSKLFWSG